MIKDEYTNIRAFLQNGDMPRSFTSNKSNFIRKAKQFTLKGGRLMRNNLPVVLYAERRKIFDQFQQRNSLYYDCKI